MIPDADDRVAANRDGLGTARLPVGPEHVPVVDDQVKGTAAIVALCADDEAGDERDRDDGDNDEGRETRSHDRREVTVKRRLV